MLADRRLIAAVLATGAAGCSLVLDAFGPYDSAAGDGGSPSGDAGAGFCASFRPAPAVCSDFDEGEPFNLGWTQPALNAGGALAVQQGVYVSPFASLKATTPPFMPSTYPNAAMTYDLARPAGTVHLESRVRVDDAGSDCFVGLAITQQVDGGPYLQVQLFLCSGSPFLQEQDNSCSPCTHDVTLPGSFSPGEWHRYALELTFGSPPVVSVWVDDASTPAVGPLALQYGWQASPYSVQAGIGYVAGPGDPVQAHFDNIEADVR